jgi:hypothetical protein
MLAAARTHHDNGAGDSDRPTLDDPGTAHLAAEGAPGRRLVTSGAHAVLLQVWLTYAPGYGTARTVRAGGEGARHVSAAAQVVGAAS